MSLEEDRIEFASLPDWAQKLVRALAGCGGYGGGGGDDLLCGMDSAAREKYQPIHVILRRECSNDWWAGFSGLRELAAAMTAPYPPQEPPPRDDMTSGNVVEWIADADDCAFDQPCYYGNRVESHAVYCHNEAWPDSPRKCRRNRDEFKHEDCPGFWPNQQAIGGSE